MKTIQIFNIIVIALLFGLLWSANQNGTALLQYSEEELIFSVKLNEHTQTVLAGKKKETVDHLLAVMQKLSISSSSRAKAIRAHADSLENMRDMILYLIIIQISIIVMLYVQYKHALKSEARK